MRIDTLAERIKLIPEEKEWWKKGSEEWFNELAIKMIIQGFTEDETIELLERTYYAVANCYGG